jgi:hypothetical protein
MDYRRHIFLGWGEVFEKPVREYRRGKRVVVKNRGHTAQR